MEGPKTRSDRDLRRGPVGARIGHARVASGLARNRHRPLTCTFDWERVTGIEKAWPAWKDPQDRPRSSLSVRRCRSARYGHPPVSTESQHFPAT